ncbi:putative entry exclusion protein TrbK-alt [Mesorhizobium sp. INR15]|uniref:putative entry exclusion protein TrbK-alt n=1 Tax=Mesorhizobium sp. INR15 TaxID=2654248 RepID=UPI001896A46C|nr:putative entry exclusion protein TrbK-alt [Mesorhizobium sp. INR15]QPC91572.1 putative entry exclusion protein TrbK-alt [Mesorhizobium sp. INR15]
MDGKTRLRLGALVFAGAALGAAALAMTHTKGGSAGSPSRPPIALVPSALREGLRHCQGLGEAALLDTDCTRLWAAQRDHFLGFRRPPANPASGVAASSADGTR